MTAIIRHTKLAMLVIAILILSIVVLVVHANALAGATGDIPQPVVNYTPPIGPEMPIERAAETIAKFGRSSGVGGEITIQVAHTSLARANAVMEDQPITMGELREQELESPTTSGTFCFSGGGVTCSPAEVEQAKKMLLAEAQSSVYMAVMAATEDFKPIEPIKRGQQPTYGKAMTIIIDGHTGALKGFSIGNDSEKPVNELGTTTTFVVAPQSDAARIASKSEPAPHFALLSGRVLVKHRPASGWRVAVGTSHTRTTARGRFAFRLRAGRYVVVVRKPNGQVCARRTVQVLRHRETRATFTCS